MTHSHSPPSSQVILGIDPGTRITGYGLIRIRSSRMEPIDFGCIRPPPHLQLSQRYHILFESTHQLLTRYTPDAIAIETQFVNKNAQSTIKLAMARAAILIAASDHQIPIFEYTPRKAKKAVSGHGGASKGQIQKIIQLLLNLPHQPEPEDAADALSLAICHAHTLSLHAISKQPEESGF